MTDNKAITTNKNVRLEVIHKSDYFMYISRYDFFLSVICVCSDVAMWDCFGVKFDLMFLEVEIDFWGLYLIQEEDSEDYGSPIISPSVIADTIKSRTEVLLKRTKSAVSSKPIVMRAEYAHCPNLTIIDTPGFVLKASSLAC